VLQLLVGRDGGGDGGDRLDLLSVVRLEEHSLCLLAAVCDRLLLQQVVEVLWRAHSALEHVMLVRMGERYDSDHYQWLDVMCARC